MTKAVLPSEPTQAVEKMLELTREMKDLVQAEARALDSRSTDELEALVDRKDKLSRAYEQAGTEFQGRVEEFRSVNQSLLRELQAEQDELQRQAHANSNFYKTARKVLGGGKQ